jgi:hypothetical protein
MSNENVAMVKLHDVLQYCRDKYDEIDRDYWLTRKFIAEERDEVKKAEMKAECREYLFRMEMMNDMFVEFAEGRNVELDIERYPYGE